MIKVMSVTAIVRLLGAVSQLLMTLTLTRVSGPYESGNFFFAYAIIVIGSAVARCGSEISGLRDVATSCAKAEYENLNIIVYARIIYCGLTSAIIAMMIEIYIQIWGGMELSRSYVVILMFMSMPIMSILGLFGEMLKAINRQNTAIIAVNIIPPMFTVVLYVALFVLTGSSESALMGASFLIATIIGLIMAFYTWNKWKDSENINMSTLNIESVLAEIHKILKDAKSLVIVSSTSIVMQWIGSIVIGMLLSSSDVAGYSVATRVSIAVSIINSAATSVMAPRIASAYANNNIRELERLTHYASLTIFLSTLPILILLFTFSSFWLSFFGEAFMKYSSILRILILGQLVAGIVGHSGMVLVMCERFKSARLTAVCAIACLAALMVLFVPFFGTNGAAAAMSIAVIVGHMSAVICVYRELHIWSFPTFTSPVFIGRNE